MSGWDRSKYQAAVHLQRTERDLADMKPTPERITAALNVCGLYGPQVDEACGVVEPAVDMWEDGTLVPTPQQVKALSALTGFPIRFFYLPPPPALGPVFICSDDGCEVYDERPAAPVIDLRPIDTLF